MPMMSGAGAGSSCSLTLVCLLLLLAIEKGARFSSGSWRPNSSAQNRCYPRNCLGFSRLRACRRAAPAAAGRGRVWADLVVMGGARRAQSTRGVQQRGSRMRCPERACYRQHELVMN